MVADESIERIAGQLAEIGLYEKGIEDRLRDFLQPFDGPALEIRKNFGGKDVIFEPTVYLQGDFAMLTGYAVYFEKNYRDYEHMDYGDQHTAFLEAKMHGIDWNGADEKKMMLVLVELEKLERLGHKMVDEGQNRGWDLLRIRSSLIRKYLTNTPAQAKILDEGLMWNERFYTLVFFPPDLHSSIPAKHIDNLDELQKLSDMLKAEHPQNNKIMSENNLAFLKNIIIDKLYFPAELGEKLKEAMEQGKSEFSLAHQETKRNETVEFQLKFRKSDTTDIYFFNSYTATLKDKNPEFDRTQEFRMRNGNNITSEEAFNLVAGRALQKSLMNSNGDGYLAWLKVDFSQKDNYGNFKVDQFHEKYGFSLEKTLDKFPIMEWHTQVSEVRQDLLSSLKAGNLDGVTMQKDGKEMKVLIEPNPRFRTINIQDENGKSIRRDSLEIKDVSKAKAVAEKPENTQAKSKKNSISV